MRRFATFAIGTGGLAGAGVFAVFISIAPGACACGEVTEEDIAWYWDDMSILERAQYHAFDKVPAWVELSGGSQ